MKKTCFVIMGFGKKMDYRNSKIVDLDIIYDKVIKKIFSEEDWNYTLVRADTIHSPGMIESSMYKLLLQADLVIADITTLNENAIYELGVRYAVRPYSTIIMKQESKDHFIPFDLSHCRIFNYQDFGTTLSELEASEIRNHLKEFIDQSASDDVDSPFYTFLPDVTPPKITKQDFKKTVHQVEKSQKNIRSIKQAAETSMKKGDFSTAILNWSELKEVLPSDPYILQQLALATYKSKSPNKTMALKNALVIMHELHPEDSLDLETLGITGAIYKNLFLINNKSNFDYLEEAIKLYHRGYIIKRDYYNGENYANCLILKSQNPQLSHDDKNFIYLESKSVYKELTKIINGIFDEKDYWKCATLALSYGCLEDNRKSQKYSELFKSKTSTAWEIETFQNNYDLIIPLMDKLRNNYKA
ncbi:TRAFs-binding domain-containing protein [Lactiplantibacillus plantarum]|uniref:TRAFs-binding domain-containing protein n=1 Tax=Lactiplantibacillus plantarum TaxID=1590 RepID=UPI003D36E08E